MMSDPEMERFNAALWDVVADLEDDDEPTYKIRRFRFEGENETIATGLTLDEAQAHCQRDDTHGDGWFDGYDKE